MPTPRSLSLALLSGLSGKDKVPSLEPLRTQHWKITTVSPGGEPRAELGLPRVREQHVADGVGPPAPHRVPGSAGREP